MLKFAATLLLVLLSTAARASDHEPVLDKTRQGEIAPFNIILSAARSVVGNRMVLLDARFHISESNAVVEVFFHKRLGNKIVVVTVDAVNVEIVDVIGHKIQAQDAWSDRGDAANSRPNAEPKSTSGDGGGKAAGGDGSENSGKATDNDGKGGKDGGRGSGGDGGKGGGSGNGGGKGGSGK